MWLARLFWLLLLLVTVNSLEIRPCNGIPDHLELLDDVNICDAKNKTLLGSSSGMAVIDFSKASQGALDEFLRQFTKIRANIQMDGNDKVRRLNLATVEELIATGSDKNDIFIKIRNNPLLGDITFNETVQIVVENPVKVLVYNNPTMSDDTIGNIKKLFQNDKIVLYIQEKIGECQFVNPLDPSEYTTPTVEFLQYCTSIKEDFILEGGAPSGSIVLGGGGCLSLTNVDLTNYKITFAENNKGTGTEMCKNGSPSIIINNPGLCEPKLTELTGYFNKFFTLRMTIQPDASCAIDCVTNLDIEAPYRPCRTANGIINGWFTNPFKSYKAGILESSSEQLNITDTGSLTIVELTKLSTVKEFNILKTSKLAHLALPKLSTAVRLVILENVALKDIDLPQLTTVDTMAIALHRDLAVLNIARLQSVNVLFFSNNGALQSLYFPQLETVETMAIYENGALDAMVLPKLSSADSLAIYLNKDLKSADFPELETVETLIIGGNAALTSIIFPKLKTVETMRITGNPSLIKVEFNALESVKNLIINENDRLFWPNLGILFTERELKLTSFEIDCNTKDPQMNDHAFTHLDELKYCTKIKGPLILEDVKEDWPKTALQHIQVVEGCITVRNTNFTNIEFLADVKTTCSSHHFLENNLNLCPITWLKDKQFERSGDYKKRCFEKDGICYDKLSSYCKSAIGDIVITGETPKRDYEILELINGSLSVVGTDLRTLIIPALDGISGSKGPLIRIINNHELSMIRMPELENVKLLGKGKGPLVEITGNTLLNIPPNALHFLPEDIRDACFEGREDICIYDGKRQHEPWTFTKAAIMMVCLVGYLALFCGCLYLCCRQERRGIRQMRERNDVIAERLVTPKRGGSTSPIRTESSQQSTVHTENDSKIISRMSRESSMADTINSQSTK